MFPLIAVHFLYKWYSGVWLLASTWSSGELITYIAGFEAFIGTAFLGSITVFLNERMLHYQSKRDSYERQPCLMLQGGKFEKVEKEDADYFLTFSFINVSRAYTQCFQFELCAAGHFGPIKPIISNNDDVFYDETFFIVAPQGKCNIVLELSRNDFALLKDSKCCLHVRLINSIGECYLESIGFTLTYTEVSALTISATKYSVKNI